jgi:hypothetical protein
MSRVSVVKIQRFGNNLVTINCIGFAGRAVSLFQSGLYRCFEVSFCAENGQKLRALAELTVRKREKPGQQSDIG